MSTNTTYHCPARNMNGEDRASIALEALKNSTPITALSNSYDVSRKFIYEQKAKAVAAVCQLFSNVKNENEEEAVLFSIPVTKSWLKQVVVCLSTHCKGSFRGIQKTIQDLMDYHLSIGTIGEYFKQSIASSRVINSAEDLSGIKLGAVDEMFDHGQPILTGIDIPSLYCYLASKESSRDGETWAVNLMDLQDKGFSPDRIIADDGSGLRAGHQIALPDVPCDGDVFHIIKTLMEMRLFFRNRLKTSITDRIDVEEKMKKSTRLDKENYMDAKVQDAVESEQSARNLSRTIDTLLSWLHHDILEKPGLPPQEREQMYDFVVAEIKKLEAIQTHRIKPVRVALQNQKKQLLAFVSVLDEKFTEIADKHEITVDDVWSICELLRCEINGDKYAIRSLALQDTLGDKYDSVEDDVIIVLCETERTSCMAENLHSRIRPYCVTKKGVNQGFLDLLRFYLNHTPFLRSAKANRKGKTPAEILHKRPHDHWLEMLGFKRFKQA